MLSSCLNTSCNASFRYLYDGRIFTVEHSVASPDGLKTERMVEHYWLCGPCSMSMKVVVAGGVATTAPAHAELMVVGGAKTAGQLAAG